MSQGTKRTATNYTVLKAFTVGGTFTAYGAVTNKYAQRPQTLDITDANVVLTGAGVVAVANGNYVKDDIMTANRTLTLPTAALLVAAALVDNPELAVGDSIDILFSNDDAAQTLQLIAGTNGTAVGTALPTIAAVTNYHARIRFTNITAASEAYDVFAVL